mmetsp:Transcript_20033/g.43571  ORF Transcript_20033/g.43571 Transcript_20033/m.43571 type:complete len:100 (-) Transcript_20033:70-369(-)
MPGFPLPGLMLLLKTAVADTANKKDPCRVVRVCGGGRWMMAAFLWVGGTVSYRNVWLQVVCLFVCSIGSVASRFAQDRKDKGSNAITVTVTFRTVRPLR